MAESLGETIVEHVTKISGHEVMPILAKCMVEVAEYGAYDLAVNWGQSAFFVRDRVKIIAALSYSLMDDKSVYWIGAAFVETSHRRRGVYRAMFDALAKRAKTEGVSEIQSSVAWGNEGMRRAAVSVGRKPIAVTYRWWTP